MRDRPTHLETCDALLRAARRYDQGQLTVPQWVQEVERILALRFPDATDLQIERLASPVAHARTTHTNTPPGSPLPAADRSRTPAPAAAA